MGVEALSRGASRVLFVDKSRDACRLAEQNIKLLSISATVSIIEKDVLRFLSTFRDKPGAGTLIVYFDPPYREKKLYRQVISAFDKMNPENLIFFVEHNIPLDIPKPIHLRIWKEKRYGSKRITAFTTIPDFW